MKRKIFLLILCLSMLLTSALPTFAAKQTEDEFLEVSVTTYSNRVGIFALDGLYHDNVFYIAPADICKMTGADYKIVNDALVFYVHNGLRKFTVSTKGQIKETHGNRSIQEHVKVTLWEDVLYLSAPDILSYIGATVGFGADENAQLHMMVSMPYTVLDLIYEYNANSGFVFSWAEAEGKWVDPEDLLELAALDTVLLGYDSNVLAYALPGYASNVEKTIHADALLELLRTEGEELISSESLEVEILGLLSDETEVSISFLEKTLEWAADTDLDKKLASKWSDRMDGAGLVVDMTASCIASLETAKQFANLSDTQKNLLKETLCRVTKHSEQYKKYPLMFDAAQGVVGLMTEEYAAGEKVAWDAIYKLLGEAVDMATPPNPVSFAWDTLTGIAKIDPLLDKLLNAENNLVFASECSDIRVLANDLLATDLAKFEQNGKYVGKNTTAVQSDIKQDVILSLKASLTARLLLLDTDWLSEGSESIMHSKARRTAELLNKAQNAQPVSIGMMEENTEDISFIEKLVRSAGYGNVVNIHGNTYYWKYDADSFYDESYSVFGTQYTANDFVCRNAYGEEEVLFELEGSGKFIIAGRQLFYTNHENVVCSIGLDGTGYKEWFDGQLCAISSDSKTVIVMGYQGSADDVNLYAIDVKEGKKRVLDTAWQFVACYQNVIYYTKSVNHADAQRGSVSLYSISADGSKKTHLYTTAPDLYDAADMFSNAGVDHIRFTEDYVFFSYGSLGGSGVFFQGAKIVRVRYNGTDGQVVAGQKQLVDGQFTVNKDQSVTSRDLDMVSMYNFGNAMHMSGGSVYLYDQRTGEPILMISPGDYDAVGSGLAGVESNGGLIMVVFVEEVNGKVYYMMHHATEDYENSIGWRVPYIRNRTLMMMKDQATGEVTVLFQC